MSNFGVCLHARITGLNEDRVTIHIAVGSPARHSRVLNDLALSNPFTPSVLELDHANIVPCPRPGYLFAHDGDCLVAGLGVSSAPLI